MDYLLIVAWLVPLFLVLGLPQILAWLDLSSLWTAQTTSDLVITILTVVPYFLYLTLTEWRPPHGTWGKRKVGLAVVGRGADPPRDGSVVLRNLVKVMPWQLGHMGTTRLINSPEATATAIAIQVASLVLLALIVVPVLFRGRGAHDLLAGTTVVAAPQTAHSP